MKKFTFKGVLDGFRQSAQPQTFKQELDVPELLKSEHFTLKQTFRHGFPYSPTSLAYDPVQKLLAIGDKYGNLRMLGRPGVDVHVKHGSDLNYAVLFIQFLVNDGSLVTITADDTMHLWNFRLQVPQIVQSLKFQRERITCLQIPVGSKWLYVGSEKGNVHVVNALSFDLSGYIVNWNKAIELVRSTHPGSVIALSDNPVDANQLLIAFECGLLVLWNLRSKSAEIRWQADEPIKSLCWHFEGKLFATAHADGSICTWPTRPSSKPQAMYYPHGTKVNDGCVEKLKAIYKVDLKADISGENLTIFSGGMASEKDFRSNCITIMQGKTIAVLEMEHAVVDFVTICESPWTSETQAQYALAVLLQNDLVVIDLLTPGYPCFESPYPMDIHESPVTSCVYLTDCPSDLVPALYSVGRTVTGRKNFSENDWPISGGAWSPISCSYSEIIITGHQDGSMKFWDSGAGTLQVLYKLKTSKVFEKNKNLPQNITSESPVAVQLIYFCSQSRRLCIAGASGYVLLFKFRKTEANSDVMVLEIPILYEYFDDLYGASPESDFLSQQFPRSEHCDVEKAELPLRVKNGVQRRPPGFQCQLISFTTCSRRKVFQVTAISLNSFYGLMAYGTENGIVVIDILQKLCLLSVASPDLYGGYDPYSRTPRSPKKINSKEEQSRSPISEQICGISAAAMGKGTYKEASDDVCDGISVNEVNDSTSLDGESSKNLNFAKSEAKQSLSLDTAFPFMNPSTQPSSINMEPNNAACQQFTQQGVSTETIKNSKSQDKLEESLSKSRSSSLSSLDMSSNEAVTCLAFIDSPIKRNDSLTISPTLWIGTSYGSVLSLLVTNPEKDARGTHPVLITINGGLIASAKGPILSLCFMDGLGSLIRSSYEPWRDERDIKKERKNMSRKTSPACSPTTSPNASEASGYTVFNSNNTASSCTGSASLTGIDSLMDRQYLALSSEKQIKIFDIVNQYSTNDVKFPKMDFLVKAEVIELRGCSCIAGYLSNGHVVVHSLPNLKPLLDSELIPLMELGFHIKSHKGIVDPMLSIWGQQVMVHDDATQVSRLFCFSRKGHGLYLASPSEIQKFTMSSAYCQFLMEMENELYTTQTMPEQPKDSFLKGFFGGGVRTLDKEELFGEQSGKSNRSVAKYISGSQLDQLGQRTSTAASEISRAHHMVIERGEKLNQLEDKAEKMANQAQDFSRTSHQLMLKYKDKKWYHL